MFDNNGERGLPCGVPSLRALATSPSISPLPGFDFGIAVHTHWELDWSDALNLARAVAPMRPMWLEDALAPDFLDAWIKLTEESPVPILTGENLYIRRSFLPFIIHQRCHVAQIDIPKSGGLLEAKNNSDLADLYDMPVCSHNTSSALGALASAHSTAAMRDFKGPAGQTSSPITARW